MQTIFTMSQLTKAGPAMIQGSGVPDGLFNFTVQPGPLSAAYTQIANEQLRVVAGQNATILISLADQFGNYINISNSTEDLQGFGNVSMLYYAKMSPNLIGPEYWQPVPKQACFDVIQGRLRCSVTTITEKGMYRWRVVIKGEPAQCINCYFRVVPTGKVNLAKTVLIDLSQNYYRSQNFAMGKFNVLTKTNFIYFKYYLRDDYENSYIHEDLPAVETLTAKLSNSSVDTSLSTTKIAQQAVFKILVVLQASQINSFSVTKEGLYQIKISGPTLGQINFPVYIRDNRTSPTYLQPKGSAVTIKTRETTYMQRAGSFVAIQFGLFANDFMLNQTANSAITDLTGVQLSIPLLASSGFMENGKQVVSQFRGFYEKYERFTTVQFSQANFAEKFTVTINGFESYVSQSQFFQTVVFPGPMKAIQYSYNPLLQANGTSFRVSDEFNNDVDFTVEPIFSPMQVVVPRGGKLPGILANDFRVKANMTARAGVIVPALETSQNMSSFLVVDSALNSTAGLFATYLGKGLVELERSGFSYSRYSISAGQNMTVKVFLADSFSTPVSLVNNSEALGNVTVKVLFSSVSNLPTSEYRRKVNKTFSLLSASYNNQGQYDVGFQLNQSGYYFIEARYFGVRLPHLFSGKGVSQWFYVDINPETSSESSYTIPILAVQKNRIFSPSTTFPGGLDYLQFMKTQPLYLMARVADVFGNPFTNPSIYTAYSLGDVALEARIRNRGDLRQLNLNLAMVWNFMSIQTSSMINRALYKQFVPSQYPLVSDSSYDNQKSFKIVVYSPVNQTDPSSPSINLKVVYLVINSDFAHNRYHSANVSSSRDIDLAAGGLQSSEFDGGLQVKIRQLTKTTIVAQVRNTDNRPYLAEQILNFTLELRNTTMQNVTINGKNTSVPVPLDTVKIVVIPYLNDAFFRIVLNSSTLYQDPYPLQVRATVQTAFKYNLTPVSLDLPLWVFPQTPPNYLNTITNTSYLPANQTKFQPATKVTFLLNLKYNDVTYMNDLQSANRIKVFRKSAIEYVTAQLINKTTYSVSVNLEGPKTNQFRIFYQDVNGALYPIVKPEVLNFDINAGPVNSLVLSQEHEFETFYYEKLGLPNLLPASPKLQGYDPAKIKIILLPSMTSTPGALNGGLTYFIGNEFRTSVLMVDIQTSRCLLQKDYNPYTDVKVVIQRFDPMTNATSRISIDVDSIQLVQKVVSQATSYCTYYSIAVLESQDQLNQEGNYSLTATFLPGKISANITFQAKVSGIDFTKTTIGWYQQSQQLNYDQKLIAEFNAYDEFNYLIYFQDVQGNYVSDRQQHVKIQIKFDQQKLAEEKDYTYISRYDDRFKGYLISIQFQKAGTFQPEYFFNLQRADSIQVSNGPVLFVVREPLCARVQVLSVSPSGLQQTLSPQQTAAAVSQGKYLSMGQLFSLVFHCYDLNGKEILQNIEGSSAKAVFTNLQLNDLQIFSDVEPLQNGIYRVSEKFYLEGAYSLKIYFDDRLIYEDKNSAYPVVSELCKDRSIGGTGQLLYKCPNNPSVCANSYYECLYINNTRCQNSQQQFFCGQVNGIPSGSPERCVSNMQTECCKINDRSLPDYKWCPHINMCVNTTMVNCPSILPSATPYYCQSLKRFVENRTQCCSDFFYNVTRTVNEITSVVTKPMVKCSFEDKCVPEDTAEFCFFSFQRNCAEIFGPEYSFQCRNDGRCRRSQAECPSPRVCPPGYTQCPDYTCVKGSDQFSQCSKLPSCQRTLPDGSIIDFIRCPDGTCSRTYEDCPSQVSCMVPGQVVCPDSTCKDSDQYCIQPSECTSDKPYRCPGGLTCAASRDLCPLPSSKSCGGTYQLCANGDCSSSCLKSNEYAVIAQGAETVSNSCASQGLVQCPNFECRSSYLDCSDTLYCPVPINYTYSPAAVICPGIQVCALDRKDCVQSQCSSSLNNQFLPALSSYDSITVREVNLGSCYDGRCHIQGFQKQQVCMTPVSCSTGYFKTGGFGEFCVSSSNLSTSLVQTSLLLNDHTCAGRKVKCVTGECRNSIDDCPSQVTCPADLPIICRDGQCVKSKTLCKVVDEAIESNLQRCQSLGLLLCTSDLITCTSSLSKCPSRSSCPLGHIKCWDESCVNIVAGHACPQVASTQIATRQVLSTCPDQFSFPFHCFADGSCRASLFDCPTISFCPLERPVKCAADNSCRKSLASCPDTISCPEGFKFCSGEGACVIAQKPCGTPVTCPAQLPFKCEDGYCVGDSSTCFKMTHSLSIQALKCVEDSGSFLCSNNQTICAQDIAQCPSSQTCFGSHLVKSSDQQVCYASRVTFKSEFVSQLDTSYGQCHLNNMYKCQSTGKCSLAPCEEWLECPDSTMTKCWDGACVSDQKLCRNKTNGCPAYGPIRCPYSANCVSNISDCEEAAKAIVQAKCSSLFGFPVACPFDGSCASSSSACPQGPPKCLSVNQNALVSSQSPSECYTPTCPEQLPFKCSNGLCVSSKTDCPISPLSLQEIQYCRGISQSTGLNLHVPCGNGQCVESASQCLPLFECSMNINAVSFIRCPDGTCRQSASQCPQFVSSISQSACPTHVPFLCSNGMCAQTSKDCLRNDNGCPEGTPYKCPATGVCSLNMDQCSDPMDLNAQMFLYPVYIPPISATPLIAVYGKTRSTCQAKGQFTCRVGSAQPYCVDRLNDCLLMDNDCPVNKPIRCGGKCLTSYLDCTGILSDNCTQSNSTRCPLSTQTSRQCAVGPKDFSNCLTDQGCPLISKPFKCGSQAGKQLACSSLSYSSYQSLTSQTCLAQGSSIASQSQSVTYFNDCTDSDFPYSCADGSCAAYPGACPTCLFYCKILKRCVRSSSDCSTSQTVNQGSVCQKSQPNRCILSGLCTDDESKCSFDQLSSFRAFYNLTFSGALLNQMCPEKTPIKCQDGRCVALYDQCLLFIRARLNTTISPLTAPAVWGSTLKEPQASTCQVVCFDGSCRDRVENCPIIHGCFDAERPYRCRAGFCGRDINHCQEMFGNQMEQIDNLTTGASSSCSNLEVGQASGYLQRRCEDGTCRPLVPIINASTGIISSYQDSCLPFMGCPNNLPYHCPSGHCAQSLQECAGISQCPLATPFRCKSSRCVSSPTQCERSFATYPALQIDRTFDPLEDTVLNFAFEKQGSVIGKLVIPSNSFTLSSGQETSVMQSLQRIQTYPVPDSLLDRCLNQISESKVAQVSKHFHLQGNRYLDRASSLLTPAVLIGQQDSMSRSVSSANGERDQRYLLLLGESSAEYILQRPLSLYFKIDDQSFPQTLNMNEDLCLATVVNPQSLVTKQGAAQNEELAAWQCVQRDFSVTTDGFMKFQIEQLGIYAVIVNPNPDSFVLASQTGFQQGQSCGFLCQNYLTLQILGASIILVSLLSIYAFCECCKTAQAVKSRQELESKRLALMMAASQSDSFYGGDGTATMIGRKSHMPKYITKEEFFSQDGPGGSNNSLDIERVKEVLDRVDHVDPPLMPGQVVMQLANQNEVQSRQIEELKVQLQEQNEREKENLKLIKRIFHQKQLIYEQMQVQSEIRSQSRKSRASRSKKRKEAINDPTIKKEYEDIEQYLSKILSETHLPEALDHKASAATFQLYPGTAQPLRIQPANPADQSLQSIPVEHIMFGGQEKALGEQRGLNSDSMKNLLAAQRNTQSTTDLEIKESRLKRKAADMILNKLGANDDFEEFKYEERAEQTLSDKKNKGEIGQGMDPDVNQKFGSPGDNKPRFMDLDGDGGESLRKNQRELDDLSSTGLDQATLQKTLTSLFSKAISGKGRANMLMGGGPVSGSVSGNFSRAKQNSAQKKQSEESSLRGSQPNRPRLNGKFDDDSEESDDNLMPFEDKRDFADQVRAGSSARKKSIISKQSSKKGSPASILSKK